MAVVRRSCTKYEELSRSVNSVSKHHLRTGIGHDERANMPARRVRRVVLQFHVVCHDDMGQHEFQFARSEETSRANKLLSE